MAEDTTSPITVNTPDGPATMLDWPSEPGGLFRKRLGKGLGGQGSHPNPVIAVELESGEVKFYSEHVIKPVP